VTYPQVNLKPGRERSVLKKHPWLYSGAINRISADATDGGVVDVLAATGGWLARGYLNRSSQIAIRLLTWDQNESIDSGFWLRRLKRAIDTRTQIPRRGCTNALRLVHAESDSLPGLIVDRYADWLVVQFLTMGIDRQRDEITRHLLDLCAPLGIFERSDVPVRAREGLDDSTGLLAGQEPPDLVQVSEHGLQFLVDVRRGQKTGFYLDQRDNRDVVSRYCPNGQVLNAFCYSGGFAVHALSGSASNVTNVDTSYPSLELLEQNLRLNGLDPDHQAEQIQGDAFEVLRDFRDAGRQFDVVILDPPKFAFSKSQIQAAARGYKDINLLALRLLRPGGILATFSCSGAISTLLFQSILHGASVDARREVQILERLSQPADHPVHLSFPEGAYLKGLICLAQ